MIDIYRHRYAYTHTRTFSATPLAALTDSLGSVRIVRSTRDPPPPTERVRKYLIPCTPCTFSANWVTLMSRVRSLVSVS